MLNIKEMCQGHTAKESVHPVIAELQGSMILGIASQVRKLQAQGKDICNLTVGDFKPEYFPIQNFCQNR